MRRNAKTQGVSDGNSGVFGAHEEHWGLPKQLKVELGGQNSMLSLYLIVKFILKTVGLEPHVHTS